jgi:hypothetical protein
VSRWANRLLGWWLGAAVLLQALLLATDTPLSHAQLLQYFICAICLMLLVLTCWRWRRYFNPHTDMLLIMCASGGLGTLFGTPMASHVMHFAVWSRMCAWMLAFGLVPSVAFSRCLRAARHHGYLVWALLIDSSTMLAGMWISTRLEGGHGTWQMISQHVAMLGGMTLGMILGMSIRSVLFERFHPERQEPLAAEAPIDANRVAPDNSFDFHQI